MLKIVVTDDRYGTYQIEQDILKEINAKIRVYKNLEEVDGLSVLREADGVLCNLFPLDLRSISVMDQCRVISRYGVGYDNVDTAAAAAKGIWVANVPDYAAETVSDHALGLLLASLRGIPFRDRSVRNGKWNVREGRPLREIRGMTLGIVGFGKSGRAFCRKASALGFSSVFACDPFVDSSDIRSAGAFPCSFDEVIAASDCISIHVPLNEDTKYMFNQSVFRKMKEHAVLINTARGPIINEADLAAALKSGTIGTAALDVFEKEPLPPESPLLTLENVVLTDHAGWYSEESITELKRTAAKNIVAAFKTGRPLFPVNQV